jgi:hypothetical protein
VICTDGRRDSLKVTLESLRFLNYRNFEVCVVCGPTEDGTRELVSRWSDPLKSDRNNARNLSISRNLGIRLAAGDIVAFLDDDAIPEPEWLDQIVAAYADDTIGGVGGFVFDHTGMDFQWRFGTTDRLADADLTWSRPVPEYNFPFSYNYPHLLGANSTFRRSALIEVGGFDEEFDYFLDETDLICRVVDAGWAIRQLDNAFVHHKSLASNIRSEARVLRSWYSVLKNKLYFGLVHRRGYHSAQDVLKHWQAFVQAQRDSCAWAVSAGHLLEADRQRFEEEADRALCVGFQRGEDGTQRLMSADLSKAPPPGFLSYFRQTPTGKSRTYCLLTREYGPGPVGGVALYVQELAEGLAELGHQVHVITNVGDASRVDFENGVWVHRLIAPTAAPETAMTKAGPIPETIYAVALFRQHYLMKLAQRKPIDAVYSPIWDCEGAAILRGGQFPLVVGLQTTMAFWLDSHPQKAADRQFMDVFGRPMLALERELIDEAHAVHAISPAIYGDIEKAYQLSLKGRAVIIPLGIADTTLLPRSAIPARPANIDVRLLFVGRLEARKGIDVLLSIAPQLLTEFPDLQIDIVGNDRISANDGSNYRDVFEKEHGGMPYAPRIVFHGEVENAALRAFFADCDLFVSPSRYESFGLVFVEAMMYGKPVVGCSIGGMVDVIVEGETGLLAAPADAADLRSALQKLIGDRELRARMGAEGRRRYEELFRRDSMSRQVTTLLDVAAARWAEQQAAAVRKVAR